MPRRPLEIPEHRDDGADEHIPQPPFRSALSDLPFCFRNSGRRSAAFSRGERRRAAPGSRQAFPHPRRRTRQLVGRDGDAGRYHTARDGATAPEHGTGAGCVGTGGAERRGFGFQHSGPLDRHRPPAASPPCAVVVRSLEKRAFRSLMPHLRKKDSEQQTVLMVQVENEMGYLGPGRDRSPEADRGFAGPVPQELMGALAARRTELPPGLAAHLDPQGRVWREVFGDAAGEVFMAWRYAIFVNSVAEAGKREYPLPMYVNAQLPSLMERPGEYPSGGPLPYYLAIYRAMAPAIDFYSPDIYWPEFEYWVKRYQISGNPIFIPEAKMDSAPWNALYAYGAAKAIGFCPFAIDSLQPPASPGDSEPAIMQVYAAVSSLEDMLTVAQNAGRARGLVLHANSPRASQSVALGGYVFEASLSRGWSTGSFLTNDGGMLLIESRPDEFFVAGGGLTVKMSRDPDTDGKICGIASIEEVSRVGVEWAVSARLNGDQSNQGRQLTMDPRTIRTYRVRLYSAAQ